MDAVADFDDDDDFVVVDVLAASEVRDANDLTKPLGLYALACAFAFAAALLFEFV